jgi:hypothetical protein
LEGLALSGASVGVALTCTFTLAEPPDTELLAEPEAALLIVLTLAEPLVPVELGFSVAAVVAAGLAVAITVAVAVAATGLSVAALVA